MQVSSLSSREALPVDPRRRHDPLSTIAGYWMPGADGSYPAEAYALLRAGTQRSAAAVVPDVQEVVRPKTVVDVGCGEGWWAAAFEKCGCDVLGIEREVPASLAPGLACEVRDLSEPGALSGLGRFDLAVCLEVAEHLPENAAAALIEGLCALAPVVLFSAAIPGQTGSGHINEQWPDYWVSLFEANAYVVSDALRWRIWNDARVDWWYRQNLLVAVQKQHAKGRIQDAWFSDQAALVASVVHPRAFAAHLEHWRARSIPPEPHGQGPLARLTSPSATRSWLKRRVTQWRRG